MERSDSLPALDAVQWDRVKRSLPLRFDDIFDDLEVVQEEVRDLEHYLNHVLGGEYVRRIAAPDNLPA